MKPKFIQKLQEHVGPFLPVGGMISAMTETKADDVVVCVIETLLDDEVLDVVQRKLTQKLLLRGINLDVLLADKPETPPEPAFGAKK